MLTAFFAVLSIQLIYWKAVTGEFIVYSYQGESFHFRKPEILNVLFSVRKGLFFWSPILLTVFPGLYFLRQRCPDFFMAILCYLPLNLYVISSWYN
jgi:hypothetical protein